MCNNKRYVVTDVQARPPRYIGMGVAHTRPCLSTYPHKTAKSHNIKVIKHIAFGFRDRDYIFLKIRGAFG